ncbi:MAG TPA: OmpH family outer membrane protein [Candidatus Acidoferrum sp.]|jgi:outer membrane protein|nr:OmpH family outer membrane protein [Candidatus Acidoferrum sp.]
MKIRFVLPVFAALAVSSIAGAQAAGPATKIATINVSQAIASTAEGKADAAQLQSQFAPRTTELQNISKQIDDLTGKLRTGENTLNDEEKTRLQAQINQLQQSGQRKQQDLSDDQQAAEQDLIETIGRKLEVVLNKYATENGYAVVLDVGSQQTSVFWSAPTVDITQQVISLYDAANPVKAGGAAPSSSAPRTTPSTPRPSTPATPPKP